MLHHRTGAWVRVLGVLPGGSVEYVAVELVRGTGVCPRDVLPWRELWEAR